MNAKHKNRKDKIEWTLEQMVKLGSGDESALAWSRLILELQAMTDPQARMPRFNPLLDAIWRAATNEA